MPIADVGDISLNYTVRGDGGDWLVMVGGYVSGNQEAWGAHPARLAESFRVLTFDNRGIAGSSAPDHPYTTRMMAKDTLLLMQHLGIAHAHVFGKSLGGAIAQWMAIDAPEAVRSIAMTSTFGIATARMQAMVRWWLDSVAVHGGFTEDVFTGNLSYFFSEKYFAAHLPEIAASVAAALAVHRPVHGYLNTGNCLLTHDTMEVLRDIRCPVQLLVGEHDIITTVEHHRALAERIPGSELHVIPGALHGFLAEVPSSFDTIQAFFRTH